METIVESEKRKILVVEDEGIVAKDLQNCLNHLGYLVPETASSGHEAIEKTRVLRPDLVLMDIMLKGEMDGIHAATRIFAVYHVPVIFLTAYDDETTLTRAKGSGAFGYILKPFDERDLRVSIEMALYKHKMERQLAESGERFETTLRCIGDAVITLDPSMRVQLLNATAERLTGWTHEGAHGRDVSDVLVIEKDDETLDLNGYIASVTHHGVVRSGLPGAVLVAKDEKTRFFVDDTAAVIKDNQGRTFGIALVFRDITERVKAEKREKDLSEQLNRAKRMESLGVLASGVAHDLNNILGPIVGYPDLIMKNMRKDNPIREDLEIIKNSARKAVNVIRDLLTLGRVGRCPSEPVVVNDIVDTYLKSASYLSLLENNPEVHVETHLHPGLLPVMGSEHHLLQLLMNLMTNAFEAMPDGGYLVIGTSMKSFKDPLRGFEIVESGDYIVLHVSDTGTGIKESDMERIFEPFYSRKKLGFNSGSGLGLAVVYGVIKDHKGFIDIKTKLNKGTEFDVYIPVAGEIIGQKTSRNIDIHGTESILIVDDDLEQRRFAERMLNMLGYKVFTARNGQEGVNVIKSATESGSPVDMVLLDMIMADGFDGLDTYKAILEIVPDQKAIIVSGFSVTDRIKTALEMGVGQYIQKPYTVGDLGKAVRRELDKKE